MIDGNKKSNPVQFAKSVIKVEEKVVFNREINTPYNTQVTTAPNAYRSPRYEILAISGIWPCVIMQQMPIKLINIANISFFRGNSCRNIVVTTRVTNGQSEFIRAAFTTVVC